MVIEINNKFNIGNLVRKYREVKIYNNNIVCPLCGGKHVVDNPSPDVYDDDFDEDDFKLYCPHCNEDGYLKDDYTIERKLDDEVYCVEGVYIHLKNDGTISHSYSLQSTPELNNRTHCYCSCNAEEDELELFDAMK